MAEENKHSLTTETKTDEKIPYKLTKEGYSDFNGSWETYKNENVEKFTEDMVRDKLIPFSINIYLRLNS